MEQQNEVKVASLLELETLEKGLYRGQSWDLGFRALFGGQVLGQALKAAWASVPEGRVAHSFHSYFLLPGDAKQPVVYDVEIVRDGKSFSARRVKAIQNGRNIFYMTASFQQPEEGMEHHEANGAYGETAAFVEGLRSGTLAPTMEDGLMTMQAIVALQEGLTWEAGA